MTVSDIERRVERVEEYVPTRCVVTDERVKALERFAEDVRDQTKWLVRAVIGVVIVCIVTGLFSLLAAGTIARAEALVPQCSAQTKEVKK